MQQELRLAHRLVELGLHLAPLARRVLHGRLVHDVAALAGRLRRVHGDVGIAHQLLDPVVGAREGDAHAGRNPHVGDRLVERLLQRLDDARGDLEHRVVQGQVLEQHGELVAAEAGHRVAVPGRLDQALRAPVQHAVADGVAVGVVDALEVVEVDEDHGDAAAVPLAHGHGMLDAVAEQRAVGEERQRVVQRHALQLFLHALAIGHVAQVQQAPADRGLGLHVRAVDFHHALALVAARHARLDDRGGAGLRKVARQEFPQSRAVVEGHEFLEALTDQVLGRKAEDPLGRRRHVADGAVGIDDRDDVGGVADQRIEARLGRAGREARLDHDRERSRDRLAREQQPRRDADHPGDESRGLAEAALVQHQERVACEHQGGIRHERREG